MATRLSVGLTALVLAFSLTLTACNTSDPGKSLVVSLDVQSQAKQGETVPLKLTVRKVFQSIPSFKTLGPGEELVLKGEWDQRDSNGETVAPGTYLVRGIFSRGGWVLSTETPPQTEVERLETRASTLTVSP